MTEKITRKSYFHWWDIIYLILLLGALYFCSGCSYPLSSLEEDEYITIYDKDWNVKYYGKLERNN